LLFGFEHDAKLGSAEGHVSPLGQHWFPAHPVLSFGHWTWSPTLQVAPEGVGAGAGFGAGAGEGAGAGPGGVGTGDVPAAQAWQAEM